MIRFEHPLSERVRHFLRIAHLFERFQLESQKTSVWAHHFALFTLFEIMECAARAELKLDILQELERQKQFLQKKNDTPERQALNEQLHQAAEGLQSIHQKFGQHLRENEWLMAIKQRMLVAGGVTPFDLPSYYCWQQQDSETRQADLQKWSHTLLPTHYAITVLLNILREQAWTVSCCADKGSYQHTSLIQNIHMLGIEVEKDSLIVPEVSANKYLTHIRFLEASKEKTRGKQVEYDVPFKMIMCSFDPMVESK